MEQCLAVDAAGSVDDEEDYAGNVDGAGAGGCGCGGNEDGDADAGTAVLDVTWSWYHGVQTYYYMVQVATPSAYCLDVDLVPSLTCRLSWPCVSPKWRESCEHALSSTGDRESCLEQCSL